MTENSSGSARLELMKEIANRKLNEKKFHSESSLQGYGEDEDPVTVRNDPGVLNGSMKRVTSDDEPRRRTMSQPGPVSGSMLTATAARAARKRPQRNVNYADEPLEGRNSPKSPTPLRFFDDSDNMSAAGDRASPLPYNGNYKNANGDTRSLNSYRFYSPNELRGVGTSQKRSMMPMDAQSLRSVETQAPPPTSPEANRELTTEIFTISVSCMYAILLVTLGVIIFIADPFLEWNVAVIYSMFLTTLGFVYMIFLLFDIQRYKDVHTNNRKLKAQHEENMEEFLRKQDMEYDQLTSGERTPELSRPISVVPPPVLKPQSHDYCFSEGRHSGSFYLKLGAAGFALGHLVHSVLLIAVEIGFILDETTDNNECVDMLAMILDFINPFYCFFQLYFIFKFSNVIIIRAQGLARFGFMHFIGSSLCFWLSAIIRETKLALTIYAASQYGNGYPQDNDSRGVGAVNVSKHHDRFLDVSGLYDENCRGSRAVTTIYENFSPYLYPFSVEFNILIVAVYYIIWSNIGHCENSDDDELNSDMSDTATVCKIPSATEENNFSSNIVIYADCHASNRGLFAGLILIVLVVGNLILGFAFSSVGDQFLEIGYLLSDISKLCLHVAMLIASVFAFNQTRKLDINGHSISVLDDVLLYICLPAFLMETVLSMVATIHILNVIKTMDLTVMMIQVIIQTTLLVDGLRRCSNSRKLRRSKPGRELIMFLLIANVGMWIFNTFSFKSPESIDERYTYYGKVMWTILGHVTLPLIMFYRFHSSVCFADIWNSAYEPGSEH